MAYQIAENGTVAIPESRQAEANDRIIDIPETSRPAEAHDDIKNIPASAREASLNHPSLY